MDDDHDAPAAGGPAAGGPAAGAPDAGPSVLRDCADAEAYVASVCFKHGPPRLLGVELEWLLHRPAAPRAPVGAAELSAALGPHAPRSLDPASPAVPLPAGSLVTVEPGGQVELASPPLPGLAPLARAARSDAAVLHRLLAPAGLAVVPRAADPARPPVRVLELPRYRAMERAFDRIGPCGRTAMSSTAAVQVCVDAGEGTEVGRRWAAAHALGPVLLAAFANSPVLHGRRTGWKSSRWISWVRADPARTAPPPDVEGRDPASAWAARVLDSPVLCVRRSGGEWLVPERVTFADWVRGALPGPPTVADLDYHVSTLFPPVRPHGHLEVRYVDAQAGRGWALPLAVLAALLSDPAVTDRAREACEPAQDRWLSAARHGLDDRVLARAAAEVVDLARSTLPALHPPAWLARDLDRHADELVHRGLCPADELPDGSPAPDPHGADPDGADPDGADPDGAPGAADPLGAACVAATGPGGATGRGTTGRAPRGRAGARSTTAGPPATASDTAPDPAARAAVGRTLGAPAEEDQP